MMKIVVTSRVGEATYLKPSSKQGTVLLHQYKNAYKNDIYELYGKPSSDKVSACYACQRRMQKVNGTRFRLPTHNCHSFTAAFTYIEANGEEFVCYITVNHTYIIPKIY